MSKENKAVVAVVHRFELTADQQSDIDRTQFQIESLLDSVREIDTIADNEQCDSVTALQKQFKGFRLEATKIIGPIKAEINLEKERILTIERSISGLAREGEELCGKLCGPYRSKVRQEQAEVQRLADIAAEQARQEEIAEQAQEIEDTEGEAAAESYKQVAQAAPVVRQDVAKLDISAKGSRVTKSYSCEVVDPSKVPARFKTIDLKKLNAEARTWKGDFDVPGCKLIVVEKQSV